MDTKDWESELGALERRWRRRLVGVVLIGMIVALAPAIAIASHQFTDVPNGHTFHGDIDHIYDARITAGCGGGEFCPEDAVSRGQMSAFLVRTGGRVAYDSNNFQFNLTTKKTLADTTIRAGNVPGGTAFIKLDASFYAYTNSNNEVNCNPCIALFQVEYPVGATASIPSYVTLMNVSTTILELESGSVTWVVAVPTGVDVTFLLTGQRLVGSGSGVTNAIGSLTATYYPFSGQGSNVLSTSTDHALPVDLTPTAPSD